MTWMQTYSGEAFDLAALLRGEPQPIHFDDIAGPLSKICRFNGHCKGFISVAEHSVAVARAVSRHPRKSVEAVRLALLHDAHEAYTGDIVRPLKLLMDEIQPGFLKQIESLLDAAIFERFKINPTDEEREVVKECDDACLAWERDNAMYRPAPRPWAPLPGWYSVHTVKGHPPEIAEAIYREVCAGLIF